MPPWFPAGLLCVGAYLLCQQITDDGWWSGVAVLRSSWSSLQGKKHFWRGLRNKHVGFSPPWIALWFDLMKTGWACFGDIFQPSCPIMVGVHLGLLLLWITIPAPFLNICHIHPHPYSPLLPLTSVHFRPSPFWPVFWEPAKMFVLVIFCYQTNQCRVSCLKQHTFIIS